MTPSPVREPYLPLRRLYRWARAQGLVARFAGFPGPGNEEPLMPYYLGFLVPRTRRAISGFPVYRFAREERGAPGPTP